MARCHAAWAEMPERHRPNREGETSMHRHLLGSAAVALVALATTTAGADEWPSRPINIVVPYSAGGITDLTIRRLEPALEKALGQEVVVLNATGHSSVGTRRVIDATPNGYEYLWTETGIMPYQTTGVTDFGYNDLLPVAAASS